MKINLFWFYTYYLNAFIVPELIQQIAKNNTTSQSLYTFAVVDLMLFFSPNKWVFFSLKLYMKNF